MLHIYVTIIKEREAMNLSESKMKVVYESCLEGEKGKGKWYNVSKK